jgi:hypothetical protein
MTGTGPSIRRRPGLDSASDPVDDLHELFMSACAESETICRVPDDAGMELAATIRALWGGQPVYIITTPAHHSAGHPGESLLANIAELATSLLIEEFPDRAHQVGQLVAARVRATWAGQSIYIRRRPRGFTDARDRQILHEFDGGNHRELCQRHGVSLHRLYQILRRLKPHT